MRSTTVEQANDAQDLASPCNTSSPAQPVASTEPGKMYVDSQGTTYFASPHWETMTDEISDLKTDFRKAYEGEDLIEITDVSSRAMSTTPLLLYGSMQPVSKEALISALPDRDIVDRLIFQYFSGISILPARVVQPSTFLKQCEEFWTSQTAVSFSWWGLLYGVLSLSDLFSLGLEHRQSHPQQTYLQQLNASFITPRWAEFYLKPVTEVGNWMVAGIIAQLAFRMGYHRDPSYFPHISPFEGENRCRAWATVHIFDSTMAMLVGAPRIISDGTWNTRPPGTISDADLDHGCAQLAGPRADNEMTEVSLFYSRDTK
ncbi:fungal specific transcription factor [Colletotrichum acutatum]